MALTDDLANLTQFVDELADRVTALENPEDAEPTEGETSADDDGITDAHIKAWAKAQIALAGGHYEPLETEGA